MITCRSLVEMNISLPPELEKAVERKVASGKYTDAGEVVREALRQSLERDEENEWLKREAAIGFAQLEAGETVTISTREEFTALARGRS